jgi:hypothetical protein
MNRQDRITTLAAIALLIIAVLLGVLIYNGGLLPKHTPTGILVRHPKGNEIDKTKCAVAISEGETSGWLVVYKQEEVTQ